MSLLIIEDDEPFLELIRIALGNPKSLRVAHTLSEAYRMIDNWTPETILLDLTLPDSPIAQTLDKIKDIKARAKNATVIVITGHSEPGKFEAAAAKGGAECVLSKDHGFFDKLNLLVKKPKGSGAVCASKDTVEKIEEIVEKIVGSDPPWPSI
jgi:DNA-binding NarL/FixJ family response regulator